MKRVLVVEDESLVALEISETVETLGGYEVVGRCRSVAEAMEAAEATGAQIVLMDIRLEGEGDGIEAAKRLGERVEVIFLTAFGDPVHIERATRLRPAAYLVKPLEEGALRAALALAAQRYDDRRKGIELFGGVCYDPGRKQLLRDDEEIALTDSERRLLELLLECRGNVLGFYEMESALWPDKPPNENRRRGLVKRLRDKLGESSVVTVAGEGYRLVLASHG